jgi:Concanavalin A-like lectin/glucanases superfamily/Fibronectin type III domain
MSPTVPRPPVLHKSNPSQIHPLCRNQSIAFFWSPPDTDGGSPILSYTLECPEASFSQTYSSSTFYAKVGGLTNGVSYTFTIKATNAIGDSPVNYYRTVQTGFKSSVPRNGTVLEISNTFVRIGWDAPSSNGGASIKWYVVKTVSNNPSDPVYKKSAYSTDRSITIYGLNSNSVYTFQVYAVNDVGYSPRLVVGPVSLVLLVSFNASSYSGSGAWNDDSGNGRNATIENGTAAKNTAGNGIVLNGSTNWIFNPIGSHPNWSILTWFKRTGNSDAGASIVTEIFTGGSLNMAIYSGAYDASNTEFTGGFFNGGWRHGSAINFSLNIWYPMVVTWDGSDVKTYIDGSLVDTTNFSGNISSSTYNNYYRIGARWDGSAYLNGEIGELIIYSKAITAPEVSNYVTQTYETYALVESATLDTLTGTSTNLSSSWTIGYAHDVTVRYYSTDSSTVPAYPDGTLVGTAQSVSAGTTVNTLSPDVAPVTGTYYFVGVTSTKTGSQEVRSTTALLMPAAAPAGSINFTYITGQGTDGKGPDDQYQYLTMSPGLSFANNDFTIEFWIKPGARGSFDDDHSEGAGVLGRSDPNGLSVFFYHWDGVVIRTGPIVTTVSSFPSALTEGTWYYITLQRYTDPSDSQGYITIWLNGTKLSDNNFGYDNESACSSASTYLGYSPEDRKYIMSGGLADIRVVVGTALYDHTNDISVPTAPFTNVSGTTLLLTMPSSIPSIDESSSQSITNTSAGGQAVATWSSSNPF